MSPISRSLPLENIKDGTPAAKEAKYLCIYATQIFLSRFYHYTLFSTKAKGREVSLSVNTLSMFHKGKRLTTTTFSMQQCTRKKSRRSVKQPQQLANRKGRYANVPHLDGSFTHSKSEHTACKAICLNREEMTLTWDVSSAVSVLLQDVALSTAATMRAYAVLTQLVTHAPHLTVVKVFSKKSKQQQMRDRFVCPFLSFKPKFLFQLSYEAKKFVCCVLQSNIASFMCASSLLHAWFELTGLWPE